MPIKTSSAKAKARRLQQQVRDAILEAHPELETDDVRSCPMGSNGTDIQLSPAAAMAFPFSVECKARASVALLYDALMQAEGQNAHTPLLVLKADRKDALAVLKFSDFMKLLDKVADNIGHAESS